MSKSASDNRAAAPNTYCDQHLNPRSVMGRPVDDLDTEYNTIQAHMPRNHRHYADYLDFSHMPLPIPTKHGGKRYKGRKKKGRVRPVYVPGTHDSVVITYLPDTGAQPHPPPQYTDRRARMTERRKTRKIMNRARGPRGQRQRRRVQEIQALHAARLQRYIDAVRPRSG